MSTEVQPKLSENTTSDYPMESDEDVIVFKDYVKAIRKHRWLIIMATALVTALASYVVSGMTPVYRATSTLLIETQQTGPMNIDELIGIDTNNREYYQTQFEILKSRKLARRVVHEMGLLEHPEFKPPISVEMVSSEASALDANTNLAPTLNAAASEAIDKETRLEQLVVSRFLGRLTVTPVKNTKLVRITFESTNPVFAAEVANKLADTYILSYLDSRLEMGEKASKWLGERLTHHKIKLEESQNDLLTYKEQNGLLDLSGGIGKLTEQEIGIVTTKLIEAEARMARAKILLDDVKTTRQSNPDALLGLPLIDSNEMVQRFKIELQQAEFNLNELLNRYGERHPKVIDAQSRKDTAKSNLDSQTFNIIDSIEKDYTLARQTVNSLQSTLDDGKQEIQQVGRSRVDLMQLEREVEINQKMYETFYSRMREVDEAENLSTTNAQISEYAEAPLGPFKPKKSLILLVAFLLTLTASMAAAIGAEAFNNKITSTDNIENDLSLRMLGIIPLVTRKVLRKSGLSSPMPGEKLEDRGHFAESIRTIRTSVCLNDLESPNQVLLITSALPGEGKSTTAGHLAHSLAQMEKVLLVECDLRKPSLHKSFELNTEYGLSELLSGQAKFRECIELEVAENLDFIPAGAITEHPLELLSSGNFNHLIEQMKKRYDRIVIDCAPIQAVSDALILGKHADAVLYTIKANATDLDISARGVKRLRDSGVNLLGAVVTQVDITKIASYGGGMDYQGYYDYYGYSDADTKLKPSVPVNKRAKTKKDPAKSMEEVA